MAIEVEGLLKIGVCLAEVAEAEPCIEILGDVVLGVKLDKHLRNLLDNHIVGIDTHRLAVAERYACVIVLVHRLLIGEEGVHVKILERIDLGRSSPTQGLDVVDKQYSLAFRRTGLGEVLLIDIVRL